MRFPVALFASLFASGRSFSSTTTTTTTSTSTTTTARPFSFSPTTLQMSTTTTSSSSSKVIPSWTDLQSLVAETPVGKSLNDEMELRKQGKGSAHVQNTLRLFESSNNNKLPPIKLYRDHAGWCPYCEKTMLLIEEKQVPIQIELVPMRSYGDKPQEFMRKVPGGLLPAIEIVKSGQIITESSVIMELLDEWHPPEDGYKPMMPSETDEAGRQRFQNLARLERELFSWWCTLLFRPELPGFGGGGGGGNPLSKLIGGGGSSSSAMSGSMQGFMDCMKKVDSELKKTKGPWFFDNNDFPTMIDFVYVSHVERMLASCAYWKGLDLRDPRWGLDGINAWLDAFEKREHYLAFKSDYYTHVKDIPPQYGPGYTGGFEQDRKKFSKCIEGKDGSWHLPLSHDDPLQPLYRGPPLPLCVLKEAGILPDADGSYQSADPKLMAQTCRLMAAWKLAGNGVNVAKFAARGGPAGAKNPRKSFGAELADPYAESDGAVLATVDDALRVICLAMKEIDQEIPDPSFVQMIKEVVPSGQASGVVSSLAYLRDRIGCPRDLPLASGRYLRAYLNWGIDSLS